MSKLEVVKELRKKTIKQDYVNPGMLDEEKETFFVNILIRGKKFRQYCGDGHQKIRWLTDCAIFKYENGGNKKKNCGIAYGLKNENGDLCNLNDTIASCLTNGANVLVLLKEEYDAELRERKRKASKPKTSKKLDLQNEFLNSIKKINAEDNDFNGDDGDDDDDEEENVPYIEEENNNIEEEDPNNKNGEESLHLNLE